MTRLIPPVIAKRRKRRLKCALTVRLAILSCRAISELSQPWSSSSAICCSRGPSRIELSFIPTSPWFVGSGPSRACLTRSNSCAAPLRATEALNTPNIWVSSKSHSMRTAKPAVDFRFFLENASSAYPAAKYFKGLDNTHSHLISNCLFLVTYGDLQI